MNRVMRFKHEYAASISNKERLSELYESLYLLDCAMDVKSPNISGIRITPSSHDERLARYITKRDKLLSEIKRVESEDKRIAHILSLMPKTERTHLQDVYHRKTTYEQLAQDLYSSPATVRRNVDKAIANALKAVDEEMSL